MRSADHVAGGDIVLVTKIDSSMNAARAYFNGELYPDLESRLGQGGSMTAMLTDQFWVQYGLLPEVWGRVSASEE